MLVELLRLKHVADIPNRLLRCGAGATSTVASKSATKREPTGHATEETTGSATGLGSTTGFSERSDESHGFSVPRPCGEV